MKIFVHKMKFRNLLLLIFAYLRLMFVNTKVKAFPRAEENVQNSDKYQYLNEKKVHFTKHSGQYIKFGVTLPNLLDFAMCVWYKPENILEHNILFSYGNHKEQLILWKIRKNQNQPFIILKIYNAMIMEEKLEGLIPGQWHHLCQYWQGSTGLWALFFNSYIVSFGYANNTNFNWCINKGNASATINHSRTKETLYGEVYGFHLMSMNFLPDENSFSFSDNNVLNVPIANNSNSKLRKRQTESVPPVDSENRPFFLGKVFTFIRRMVSFVALPVFRFVRGLIVPWRKKFFPSKPSIEKSEIPNKPPPTSVTEIITDFRSVTENNTVKKRIKVETNIISKKNESLELDKLKYKTGKKSGQSELSELEESLVIYETESDIDSRFLRNILNNTNQTDQSKLSSDSMESLILPEETSRMHTYSNNGNDKCAVVEEKFKRNFLKEKVGFTNRTKNKIFNLITTSTENPVDAITHLGTSLQFMQILYMCCHFHNEDILLSWDRTKMLVNNAVVENISGCVGLSVIA